MKEQQEQQQVSQYEQPRQKMEITTWIQGYLLSRRKVETCQLTEI